MEIEITLHAFERYAERYDKNVNMLKLKKMMENVVKFSQDAYENVVMKYKVENCILLVKKEKNKLILISCLPKDSLGIKQHEVERKKHCKKGNSNKKMILNKIYDLENVI